MPDATEFLELVLPNEGCYAGFWLGRRANIFADDIRALVARIQEADKRGETIYHGCATFRTAGKRTAANAHSAKAFWLDVDTQLTHKDAIYADPFEAAEAVAEFCARTGLPVPIYVCSGGGLNIYWPLDVPMEPDTWKTYAGTLKQLCRDEGLAADSTRTSDITSVLRTPGTHNRKTGIAVEVVCGPLVGPYPIEAFGRLANVRRPQARRDNRVGIASGFTSTFDTLPRSADSIAASCGQIAALRDNRGNLPEPLWFAGIGVLVWCEDGEQRIHEWSSGYEGYTHEETQGRIERKKQLTGATTCAQFHSLNPKVCEACPHYGQIKSPISLGTRYDRTEEKTSAPSSVFGKTEGPPLGHVNGLPDLPDTFSWNQFKSLVTKHENSKGGPVEIIVSQYPIYLEQVQTGEIHGEWNFIFKQFLPEKQWFDVPIPAQSLYGPSAQGLLAAKGANIREHSHFLRYCRLAVDQYYRVNKLTMQYDQFGWKEDETAFLYGLDLYRASGVERVPGNSDLTTRCQNEWVGPRTRGTLDGWKAAADKLFTAGCESQSIALLAGFAAPLMRFQDRIEGGAIIHFVTYESGTGKSTALIGAASIWGEPRGLGLINDDTRVSRALTLGAMGNLPVIYDEMTLRDPEMVRQFVIMFTGGRDKMRGQRNGEIKHTASQWQTILISAANTSLHDQLAGLAEGPAYRVLEFSSEIPTGLKGRGDELRRQLLANSGHAGKAYIEWLVQPENLKWTVAFLHKATQQLWDITHAHPEMRFWIRTTAAILVGGFIAKNLGLVEFSPDRIREWLLQYLRTRMDKRFEVAHSPFAEFINEHRDCILYVAEWKKGERSIVKREPPRNLFIRFEEHENRYYIDLSRFKAWLIKRELNFSAIMKKGIKSRLVVKDKQFLTLGRGTDIPGGQTWVTVIDGAHEDMGGMKPTVTKDNVLEFEPRTRL